MIPLKPKPAPDGIRYLNQRNEDDQLTLFGVRALTNPQSLHSRSVHAYPGEYKNAVQSPESKAFFICPPTSNSENFHTSKYSFSFQR